MSLRRVYWSTHISSTHLPPMYARKPKEAFHLHESTLLLWEPKQASWVLLNAQQMLALVLWDAEYWCQWSLAVFIESPDLGTGSAALSVPSCTLCGHQIANGYGLCTSIISLDLLNAFTAKPGQGKTLFLCTTQYKLIKCGSSVHIIQSKTKLNICEVPKCQNMQRRLWRWITKGPSLLGGWYVKNILWKYFNPKPIYLLYNPLLLSNNGIDCVLFS